MTTSHHPSPEIAVLHPRATVRASVPLRLDRDGPPVVLRLVTFDGLSDPGEHVALRSGPGEEPLVRIHSECLTGDVFGSARCDCGPQLADALDALAAGPGVILYLRQEGRGIGLVSKIDAYVLQDRGIDTFTANRMLGRGEDERDYTVAAQMLEALGIRRIRLLTNNPDKVVQLRAHGIEVSEVVSTRVHATPENARYLRAKRTDGHALALPSEPEA